MALSALVRPTQEWSEKRSAPERHPAPTFSGVPDAEDHALACSLELAFVGGTPRCGHHTSSPC